jgi:hypothetical protein
VLAGGGGLLCTTEGPANTCNCNPGCDPGGAICCIAFVDGGTQPEGGQPVDGGTATADFVGTWSCPVDDAGDALSFTVIANGADLTETFSVPLMGGGGNLTCAEQFTVSGSTATLIPSLTSCMVPQGVDLEGVPAYGSQTVSGNTLTYAEEDEGGPLQTVSCTRQ